ncbi:MAG: hypothetical protein EAZ67_10775 [Cytophagales bacterium]|nr:MAG: hypothetical protein EAZ67_10775 [Cytophagales bacterium]
MKSDMPLGPKRQFYFYLVEKGTGKPYLSDIGFNDMFKSIKDEKPVTVSIHQEAWGSTYPAYSPAIAWGINYSARLHQNYGIVFGPVIWEQDGWREAGSERFLIRLGEVVGREQNGAAILGRRDSTAFYLYPQPKIVDESECNALVWIEYYKISLTRTPPDYKDYIIRPYFYRGNGETDTLRIEM